MSRLRNICLAFCILQIALFVHGTGLYSVVGPGTIRSNHKYNVAVSLHKADSACQLEVGITGPSYNETKTIDLQPMSTQSVEFDVPKLLDGDYNLTAKGVSGISFENSTKLNYADHKPSTYIQTDKATYKPGDLVQFRVLFLDENTRPAKIAQPISVLINDGARNRIKQLQNIELTKGVYSGQFQLSEQPVLGSWNIEVLVNGENVETKSFEVDKYVLPKFDVAIETAKDVAIPDGVIRVTVRSKYTYGKSVKGKATVSIEPSYNYYTSDNVKLTAEKTVDIDGKAHAEFDLAKDLQLNKNQYTPPMKITAVVTEELTDSKQNTTTTVNLHAERYRMEAVEPPYNYHPGKPIAFTVAIKKVDGTPATDAKGPVTLIVEPPRRFFWRAYSLEEGSTTVQPEEEKALEFESKLNEQGIAKFEFTLPESNHTYYTIKCKYQDTTAHLSSLSKYMPVQETLELLKLTVLTKKPQLGEDVAVEVKSSERLPYFVYTIVARGNILKTERIDVPADEKSYVVKFTPSFEMVPKASFYIHYIYENNLRFEEVAINFEKDFQNSIDISAQPQAKPGEDVSLKIKTDPDSFVGLLGVDQSVLLLKSGNDLSKDQIFNSLSNFDTSTPWQHGYGRYPGQTSGLVTLTNANYPFNDDFATHIWDMSGEIIPLAVDAAIDDHFSPREEGKLRPMAAMSPEFRVRKEFQECWFFTNFANTEGDSFTLAKKIPDTITSWVITGFSLNPKTGFALTDSATKIKVFQPFFVSTNLPYSVKRGEVIAIPVIIFNYMDKALDAEVTMDNADKEYEFTEATNEVDEKPIDVVQRVKRVTIPSNTGKSVSFMIRPKKVGTTTLKISAVTPLAGDAIHQTLKVEPEGVTQYANQAVLVNLNEKPEYSQKLAIEVPAEAVPDSEYIEFSVVGDLLGPTIKNLDKLVRMPYGCGEQNMVNFVPNILVLRYLEAIKQNKPTIVEKAKKFLEIGYQRELTYKHDDGSYSAFGKSDNAGSTWLTAYVVRSFHQAARYTDIDPKIIVEGLDFLASKQAPNGSFPEYGKLFDSAHQNELGLTAFVLLAFLENVEHLTKYKTNIDNALKYLNENVEKTNDQYSLAIAASALQLAKNPLAEKVLAQLQSVAKQEDDRKWWSKDAETKTDTLWWQTPRSNDVEITSYVLIALLEKEPIESALPIIKWLISQRNSNGGFASTKDTVVGLEALIKFAEKIDSGSGTMEIDYESTAGTHSKGTIKVDPENALVLQTHVLPKDTRQLDFSAKGKGTAMVQLSYRYNLAEKDKKPSFNVQTTVKDNTAPQQLIVEVCAEFVPLPESAEQQKESNMAVMEVSLPSGYTADAESFEKIEAVDRVKRTETKNDDSTVIVYFDSLAAGDKKCVPVEASKTHAVAKQRPAAVNVYDYYDTARRGTTYYEVSSSLCDICEGDDCGDGCKQ